MPRQTVVVALPEGEAEPIVFELAEAGYDPLAITSAAELEEILESRREVALAILDGETDLSQSLEYYSLLHDDDRSVPSLMVVSPRALDTLMAGSSKAALHDEYFTRPFTADALRWRVEAMLIRAQTVDDGSGPVIESVQGLVTTGWDRQGTVIAVFNPKGGVGKTTVALNLAAVLRVRHGRRVLLVDADTVTGHVASSLGLEQFRTVADAWAEDIEEQVELRPLTDVATAHQNGLQVVVLTSSPLDVDALDHGRIGEALAMSRRAFDFVIIDMHPSYSEINQTIFERADRILVPITPDVPALKAGVQMVDIADRLDAQRKLAMVVNRANSGVSVADMERTVGMPALAQIRSGGLLFVRAANEGQTVVEKFPRERVTEDFYALADSLLAEERQATAEASRAGAKGGFRLFRGSKAPAGA